MPISPDIETLIDEIRDDRVQGASQLARRAAQVLKTAAVSSQTEDPEEFLAEMAETGEKLMSARPAMAPVYNIVSRLLKQTSEQSGRGEHGDARRLLITGADEAIEASLEAVERIAVYASGLIEDENIILTHSYSSTVMAVLRAAHLNHGDLSIIVTRSGPGRTGERAARELAEHGLKVTFIDDAAAGLYLRSADMAMVGADRICADGSLINGIGTCQVAEISQRAGKPFYVLCETLKLDARLNGDEVDLEEKEASEVVAPGRLPAGVTVKNPYFDVTPTGMITKIITENGLFLPDEILLRMKE